jgi:alpha-ribazole phosphatase
VSAASPRAPFLMGAKIELNESLDTSTFPTMNKRYISSNLNHNNTNCNITIARQRLLLIFVVVTVWIVSIEQRHQLSSSVAVVVSATAFFISNHRIRSGAVSVARIDTYRKTILANSNSESIVSSSAVRESEMTVSSSSIVMNLPPVSSTAKRIFWVRHGEVINPGSVKNQSVYYGSMDVPLSPLGEQEAMAAAYYLSQYTMSAVYSSNLSRAIYGAEQVRLLQPTLHNTTITQIPDFMELDRGVWCGQTLQEIGADVMARFDACDESVTPKDGESYRTLQERVMKGRNHVLQQLFVGQCATVVSHLQVTRCVLSDALQIPIEQMSKIPVATASVTCIDYDYGDMDSSSSNNMEGITPKPIVHFQSYKPDVGLRRSKDGAN